MAMFEYFPGNYIWNLSVDIAIESGAQIGEIEEICRPIKEAAARGADAGTAQFFDAWYAMAEKLAMLADEDESKGRTFSAATKLHRAALYYQTAERMQARTYAPRWEAFRKGIASFQKAISTAALPSTAGASQGEGLASFRAARSKARGRRGPWKSVQPVGGRGWWMKAAGPKNPSLDISRS